MPLYEYECKQCKKHTEKIQKFSDPEITQCPHCGGLLTRVISAAAISFKGGGWYKDGYSHAKHNSFSESSTSSSSANSSSTSSSSTSAVAPAASTPAPAAVPSTAAPASK